MTTETREDVNLVVYRVLRSFLDRQKHRTEDDQYDDYGDDDEPSSIPILMDEQIELLETQLLTGIDAQGRGAIQVLPIHDTSEQAYNDTTTTNLVETFAWLDKLQPDIDEDEEAYKCAWDIVTSLYGEESTKMEMEGGVSSTSWTVRSGIVRLLIHYQFLYHGVMVVDGDGVSSD